MKWYWIVLIVLSSIYAFQTLIYHLMIAYQNSCTGQKNVCGLTIKKFKSLHSISPNKYKLYRFNEYGPCVKYTVTEKDHWGDLIEKEMYYLYFRSMYDWILVKLYIWGVERRFGNYKRNQITQKFLKEVQNDIEEYKQKYDMGVTK